MLVQNLLTAATVAERTELEAHATEIVAARQPARGRARCRGGSVPHGRGRAPKAAAKNAESASDSDNDSDDAKSAPRAAAARPKAAANAAKGFSKGDSQSARVWSSPAGRGAVDNCSADESSFSEAEGEAESEGEEVGSDEFDFTDMDFETAIAVRQSLICITGTRRQQGVARLLVFLFV